MLQHCWEIFRHLKNRAKRLEQPNWLQKTRFFWWPWGVGPPRCGSGSAKDAAQALL